MIGSLASVSPRVLRVLMFGLFPISLAACAPGGDLKPLPIYDGAVYHLGVGDQVRVITYGEQQLSQEFRIGDRGNFTIPLLGSVHASGLTSTELETEITEALRRRDILRHPSVAVEIVTYRPITVLGEVAKPGQYPYQPGMTLLTAVGVAGGFTYRSVESYAYVVRPAEVKAVVGKITPQDYVQPGDVIKIYERMF